MRTHLLIACLISKHLYRPVAIIGVDLSQTLGGSKISKQGSGVSLSKNVYLIIYFVVGEFQLSEIL